MELDEFLDRALVDLVTLRDNAARFANIDDYSFVSSCLNNCLRSKAQLFQDLFVLHRFKEKAGGYFVEFGATNGVDLSNTYLLETSYQWNGILAEPARCWHKALAANRNCAVDTRCVSDSTGSWIEFNETAAPEYSTINALSQRDKHREIRREGELYQVETVSLVDLLLAHNAPRTIDYLSIDTEGSEFAILSAFDFARFDIGVITVEHNFTPDRGKIHSLLNANGYKRVFERFSRWDDWYVRR